MSDTSKTAKIIKRWYHSPSHRLTDNVLLNNITFCIFLYIYICCFITITKFLCWWSITNHLLFTAMKTLYLKYFGVTWRHRNVTTGLGICGFLLVVHWNHASILHRYRDMKPQSCICPLHVKGQKFLLRVTWPVGRGFKMTTYLEFPRPYCLFTIQLLWAYDDD